MLTNCNEYLPLSDGSVIYAHADLYTHHVQHIGYERLRQWPASIMLGDVGIVLRVSMLACADRLSIAVASDVIDTLLCPCPLAVHCTSSLFISSSSSHLSACAAALVAFAQSAVTSSQDAHASDHTHVRYMPAYTFECW